MEPLRYNPGGKPCGLGVRSRGYGRLPLGREGEVMMRYIRIVAVNFVALACGASVAEAQAPFVIVPGPYGVAGNVPYGPYGGFGSGPMGGFGGIGPYAGFGGIVPNGGFGGIGPFGGFGGNGPYGGFGGYGYGSYGGYGGRYGGYGNGTAPARSATRSNSISNRPA